MKHALRIKPLLSAGALAERSWLPGRRGVPGTCKASDFYGFKQTYYGSGCHTLDSGERWDRLVISIQASVSRSLSSARRKKEVVSRERDRLQKCLAYLKKKKKKVRSEESQTGGCGLRLPEKSSLQHSEKGAFDMKCARLRSRLAGQRNYLVKVSVGSQRLLRHDGAALEWLDYGL